MGHEDMEDHNYLLFQENKFKAFVPKLKKIIVSVFLKLLSR